ncbi:tetratricopeptide repeat protein [Paenibacillus tarimensis]|uniref:tetratricopeptide repeat protein n=1 Tax=Paenibacillus tarimensis TaxID=416012 RepID=UPI001F1C0A02|nr:tetratricopeptide repeat protein [Paenibacillus tarimensis]MCF2943053.1 tetratricopeptide repeat protein [Paenibacillus tarimensis]
MFKLFSFGFLWYLFGNPFVAILVLLVILYLLDRRFIGLSPSLVKPLKRRSRIAKLKQQLLLNPNDRSSRMELAHLLIEKRAYHKAGKVLAELGDAMEHSAEYWDDLGNVYLHTGELEKGEEAVLRALSINPRVKYGQPYLRLAAASAKLDTGKALAYLNAFRELHSSSCEAYYRLGVIYKQMDRKDEAKHAFREAQDIYRSLPKYKKRQERVWAVRSLISRILLG